MDIARGEYMNALEQIVWLADPPLEQLYRVLPHIPEAELRDWDLRGRLETLALPPVLVDDMVHMGVYDHANQRFRVFPTQVGTNLFYSDEAAVYARTHWHDAMGVDDWTGFVLVHIDDPASLDAYNRPRRLCSIGVGLAEPAEVVFNPRLLARVSYFDATIVIYRLHWLEIGEIQGYRPYVVAYNCARCGDGMGMDACRGCERTFQAEPHPPWDVPLPPQLVAFAEHTLRHEFESHPSLRYRGV
jgi:hypothetical protein